MCPEKKQRIMITDNTWHWQEEGTAWRGVGIYHLTLAIASREPLLHKKTD